MLDKTYRKLNEDMNFLKKIYDEQLIIGIFYCDLLQDKTEAIIVPTFHDVCLHTSLINAEYSYNGHEIKCLDVRYIYQATAQGHPEVIQSLYTEYLLLNPKYEHLINKLLKDNRDIISAGITTGNPAEELTVAIMKICRTAWNEESNAVRFIKQITDAEKLALEGIVSAVGDEGTFSQAKVASAVGVSRLTMSNLVGKMESCGVAKIENCGRHGTYIKIIDDTCMNIRGVKYI